MHRSQLCADRVSGRTISPMRMARETRQLLRIVSGAMSIRFARCQRVVIPCAVRRPRSSLDFAATRNSREAPQTLALLRAHHGRRRHRFDGHPRDLQLATEIAHCVARAPTCKNYVEVRLTELGSEPRNSSISASERSSPAHSCDLCIGVVNGQPTPAGPAPACWPRPDIRAGVAPRWFYRAPAAMAGAIRWPTPGRQAIPSHASPAVQPAPPLPPARAVEQPPSSTSE